VTALSEWRREPHWSFSQLNGLLRICSLQWAFRYVYQQEPQHLAAELPFGRAFHVGCTHAAANGARVNPEEVVDCFAASLDAELKAAGAPVRFKEGQGRPELQALGKRMLTAFCEALDPEEMAAGFGIPFKVELPAASGKDLKPIIGEVDAVVSKDGVGTIVDYKSSARKWPVDKADKSLQATIYAYAFSREPNEIPGVRFDVVTKTKSPTVTRYHTSRTEDDFDRLIQLVETAERMMRHEIFVPNEESFACAGCPFTEACKPWHRKRNTLMLTPLASAA
jgi:putative RecB family exonuclease